MHLPIDMKTWVDEKLTKLTIEEKSLLLSGVDLWRTYPVPRLGIPQLKVSFTPGTFIVNSYNVNIIHFRLQMALSVPGEVLWSMELQQH